MFPFFFHLVLLATYELPAPLLEWIEKILISVWGDACWCIDWLNETFTVGFFFCSDQPYFKLCSLTHLGRSIPSEWKNNNTPNSCYYVKSCETRRRRIISNSMYFYFSFFRLYFQFKIQIVVSLPMSPRGCGMMVFENWNQLVISNYFRMNEYITRMKLLKTVNW